jgi:hypothetical protein
MKRKIDSRFRLPVQAQQTGGKDKEVYNSREGI